jgi:short subunit dehydrogenase-like uncharacterized protein
MHRLARPSRGDARASRTRRTQRSALRPPSMPRSVSLAIVGATGFTGSRIVLELTRLLSTQHPALPARPLSFAVVGRSRQRLEELVARVAKEVPAYDSSSILLLVADAADESALRRVAASCDVVVSAAGPFARLGDLLLDACVAEHTHYCDVTGEPLFMERAELALHEAAEAEGVLLVPGCGFDSIPADVGCAFAVETLRAGGATATGVECYLTVKSSDGGGFVGHYATLESAVAGIGSVRELRRVRSAYDAKHPDSRVPRFGPSLGKRDGPHWASAVRSFALPFIGADASVVRRTQRSLIAAGVAGPAAEQLPVQFSAYVTFKSAAWLAAASLMGGLMSWLCKFTTGRALVLAAPQLFSLGTFSHKGPSEAQMASTQFSMSFFAQGRTGIPAEVAAAKQPSNSRAVVRVSGPEPGYVATPRIVLAAAFELLEAASRVPARGGVLTPAAAFRGPVSTLRARLESMGACRFEVLQPASSSV